MQFLESFLTRKTSQGHQCLQCLVCKLTQPLFVPLLVTLEILHFGLYYQDWFLSTTPELLR